MFLERKEKRICFLSFSSFAEYVEVAGRSWGIFRMENSKGSPLPFLQRKSASPAMQARGSLLVVREVAGRRTRAQH